MSVELSRREECAVLVLNRPDALNALSFAIVREVGAALDEVGTWPVRAIIVTGAGRKAFCAGADIKELRGRGLVDQKRGAEQGKAVFSKLKRLPFASVAVINGYAFGGGLSWRSPARLDSRAARPRWAYRRSSSGSFPAMAGRNACADDWPSAGT